MNKVIEQLEKLNKLLLVVSLFFTATFPVASQSDVLFQQFKAFGVNPAIPNDTLFIKLKQAKDFPSKYKRTLDIIKFHEAKGTIDSIIFYGNKLYVEAVNAPHKNNDAYLAESCYIVGKGKLEKGLFDEALKWFFKGIDYTDKHFETDDYVRNRIGIGSVKAVRGNTNEGKKIIEECIVNTKNDTLKNIAITELAVIHYSEGDFSASKQLFYKAQTYFQQVNLTKKSLQTDLWLSSIYYKEGDLDQALTTCYHVFNEALALEYFTLYAKAGSVIGNIYLAEKDFENAKKILSTVHINSIQWGNFEIERQAILKLQEAYAKTGDYKNAYALMTQLNRVNNEILVSQNKQQVNELEFQYKTAEQAQEIAWQKAQKFYILIGFVIVLVPVLALLYMYYQKLQTQSKLTKTLEKVSQQKIAALLKDQELQLVTASLKGQNIERKRIAQELHDSIGGNLATIKLQLSNMRKINKENLIQQIDDTYVQVRELSHNLMPNKFKNTAFTLILSEYIARASQSSQEEITLQLYPKDKLNKIDEHIKIEIYKVIQELLTNALKHAEASQIDIQLSLFNNNIKLLFEDDGKGFEIDKIKLGLGFQNLKDRLKKMEGNLCINSSPNRGTVIDIDIPLTK